MANNTLTVPFTGFRNQSAASLITRYNSWAVGLQPHRVMLMAGFLLFHGNITIPVTMFSMHHAGAAEFQFLVMTAFTMLIVISNLSAQPTKITIPSFIIGSVAHMILVLTNLFQIL